MEECVSDQSEVAKNCFLCFSLYENVTGFNVSVHNPLQMQLSQSLCCSQNQISDLVFVVCLQKDHVFESRHTKLRDNQEISVVRDADERQQIRVLEGSHDRDFFHEVFRQLRETHQVTESREVYLFYRHFLVSVFALEHCRESAFRSFP